MDSDSKTLASRLEAFELPEKGGAEQFSRRLVRENGWTLAYAERVVREYKRFVTLAVVGQHPVSPPWAVDRAWHLHLLHTEAYRDFCDGVLGRPLHHRPSDGTGAFERRCRTAYAATRKSYAEVFGEPPPEDIWLPPAAPACEEEGETPELDTYQLAALAGGETAAVRLAIAKLVLAGTVRFEPMTASLQREGAMVRPNSIESAVERVITPSATLTQAMKSGEEATTALMEKLVDLRLVRRGVADEAFAVAIGVPAVAIVIFAHCASTGQGTGIAGVAVLLALAFGIKTLVPVRARTAWGDTVLARLKAREADEATSGDGAQSEVVLRKMAIRGPAVLSAVGHAALGRALESLYIARRFDRLEPVPPVDCGSCG